MPRPRDPDIDRRIARATLELLARDGYAALSLSAVAHMAGVGKPALYRRHSSKAALVFAATFDTAIEPAIPDTGSFEGDIRLAVANLAASLKRPPREVLADQIGLAIANPGFRTMVREARHAPNLKRAMTLWQCAIARGEVDPSVDGPLAMRDLASAVVMQVLVYDDTDEVAFLDALASRFVRSVAPQDRPLPRSAT